jgi:hypothetical protein
MGDPRNWNHIAVDFSRCTETMEEVFGDDWISPGILSRRLWAFVKLKGIKRRIVATKALGGIDRTPQQPLTPVDNIDDVRTFMQRRTRAYQRPDREPAQDDHEGQRRQHSG